MVILINPIKASDLTSLNQLDLFETERLIVRKENYEGFQNRWLHTSSWPTITLNHVKIDNVTLIDPDIIPPSLFVGYSKLEPQLETPIVVYALGFPHIMESSFVKQLPYIQQTMGCLNTWYFEECIETAPDYRGKKYMNELRSYIIEKHINPFLKKPKISKDGRLFLGIASYALNAASAQSSSKLNFLLCQTRPSEKGCYLLYTSALWKDLICFPEDYQIVSREIIQLLSRDQKKDDAFNDELNEIHHFIAMCFRYQTLKMQRIANVQLRNFLSLAHNDMPDFLWLSITDQLHNLPCFKECATLINNKIGTDLSFLDRYLDDFSVKEKDAIRLKLQVALQSPPSKILLLESNT